MRLTNMLPAVPGPCDLCRAAELECRVDVGRRRQRPYYFVSEEEYRHMQKILKHYLPDTDLTPATLRWIASQCEERQRGEDLQASPVSNNSAAQVPRNGSVSDPGPFEHEEDHGLHEIVTLHDDLGCMLADAQGQYRKT